MKIDIFHVVDEDLNKFLGLVGIIQFLMLFALLTDVVGLKIPIFQDIVGFIYLTFIPGILILRILKIHHLSTIEMLLYTVGLSLSSLMFLGFFINLFYPLIGISKPFTYFNITLTITCFVIVLMALTYYNNKNFPIKPEINEKFKWTPSSLFLLLLPLIAIYGAVLVNNYSNNLLLLVLILLIATLTILICFDRFLSPKLYPLAIFIFAISLLLHRSLVNNYLWGNDIQFEYYFSNYVLTSGIWSWDVINPYNGVLSTNILAPIYSIFCNIDIRWIFKTVYQFFYALVPVALYFIFKKQTNNKIAFLACFFFIGLSTFYSEMPALARQEVAELFLVILILLYFNQTSNKIKLSFLSILFIFSIIASHYALSYIYMFIFGLTWILTYIIQKYDVWKVYLPKKNSLSRFKSSIIHRINPKIFKGEKWVSSSQVLLFIVFTVAWYIYIASSSSFDQVVRIGNEISNNIFTEFLNSSSSQGLFLLTSTSTSFLYSINKVLLVIAQIFIVIGFVSVILSCKKTKFQRDYLYFSLINLGLLFLTLLLPLFASSLNTTRLYHISLIFLAPFCIIGGIFLLEKVNQHRVKFKIHKLVENPYKILSIFFVIIFLFNSGFVYEITKDHPHSASLSQNWLKEYGNDEEKIGFFSGYTPPENVASAQWLSTKHDPGKILTIFAGSTDTPTVASFIKAPYDHFSINDLANLTANYHDSYIYLGYIGLNYDLIGSSDSVFIQKTTYVHLNQIKSRMNKTFRIYDNGNSMIYLGA